MNILYVEARRIHHRLESRILRRDGHEVDTSYLPEESFGRSAKRFSPSGLAEMAREYDVLILNRESFSERTDGEPQIERYLTQLRSEAEGMPRVIVTAGGSLSEIENIEELCDELLIKPYSKQELIDAVKSVAK